MPSVDEVGRYFPLTIAHAGPHRPWSAYLEAKQWYDSAEHIALLALEDELGYSQYMGYFEQLAVPEYALGASIVAEPAAGVRTHNTVFEHIDNEDPKPNALQLLDFNAQKMLGAYSLWWTEGSDSVVSSLLSCSGLPDSGQFAAMLDGQWQQWGWNHSTLVAN